MQPPAGTQAHAVTAAVEGALTVAITPKQPRPAISNRNAVALAALGAALNE